MTYIRPEILVLATAVEAIAVNPLTKGSVYALDAYTACQCIIVCSYEGDD